MNRHNTKTIILRRVDYEEADRILSVITPEHGKLSLFAKGARRAKSKLAGGLELFCVSDVTFIDGKSDLKTVVSARLDRQFTDIVKNVDATMATYDFLKLIDDNTQDSCDEQFFYLLEHSLASLAAGDDLMLTKAWFYTQILRLGGRSLNLEQQVDGSEFAEDAAYSFQFDDMGFVANPNGHFAPKHIKFLRLLSKVDTPANLLKVEGAEAMAHTLAPVLEQCTKASNLT